MNRSIELFEASLLWLLGISLVFSTIRLIRGPSIADRVMALDLISVSLLGLLSIQSMLSKGSVYLDIAIVIALISFVGTVGFSLFMIRRAGS